MAVIENPMTFGRPRLDYASQHDIDEFVEVLGKYERAEITPEEWRRFRLVRGTYGQRQDNVQMMRIKIPQGIITSSQMRALAGVAARYSRGFCHVTTRQNIQYHFVQLSVVEDIMRELAAEGLTTREACGNSVRNITGCQYAGTSEDEIFDPTPYAEAMTRYFLRHPLAASLPRKFKIAFEGCRVDHAVASINDLGWRSRIQDGRKGFRVTVAGGTSILPVSGYVLYDFLPVEEMLEVAEAVVRVFHRFGDYEHRQRNRLKFTIKALGWDGFRARFDECLAEFRAEGGARLPFDPDAVTSESCADVVSRGAADAAGRRRGIGQPGHGSRHPARERQAAAAARHLPPLDAEQRQPAAAGRLLPCHRPAAAWRFHGRADARAGRSGRRVCGRHAARDRRSERAVSVGQDGLRRAVLPAAGCCGAWSARRRQAERRRQLPWGGKLPSGGDPVARAWPGADRAS